MIVSVCTESLHRRGNLCKRKNGLQKYPPNSIKFNENIKLNVLLETHCIKKKKIGLKNNQKNPVVFSNDWYHFFFRVWEEGREGHEHKSPPSHFALPIHRHRLSSPLTNLKRKEKNPPPTARLIREREEKKCYALTAAPSFSGSPLFLVSCLLPFPHLSVPVTVCLICVGRPLFTLPTHTHTSSITVRRESRKKSKADI